MPFLCTIASGSSGNAALLSDGKTHILVDAGITYKRLTAGLSQFDLKPADISAVLITHEHSDHTKGIKTFCNRNDASVYLTEGTAAGLVRTIPNLHSYMNLFSAGSSFEIGGIGVESFSTPHDAADSVGYVFNVGSKKLAYVTDLGHVTTEIRQAVMGSECLFIESNHDLFSLVGGPYPEFLKRRILGKKGHLSNDDCADFALSAVQWGARKVTLCHLSDTNNTPELAGSQTISLLEKAGANPVSESMVCVAPADSIGEPYYF